MFFFVNIYLFDYFLFIKIKKMNCNLHNIIILFILIIIGYYLYTQLTNKNVFLEGFTIPSPIQNVAIENLNGNPLISRDIAADRKTIKSSSITLTPDTNNNVLISTRGLGWRPVDSNNRLINTNNNIIINLNNLNKINSIVISGIRTFKVFYSKSKNDDAFSYEEVLYKMCNNIPLSDSSITFETPSDNGTVDICYFGNLTTTDNKPVYANYIKIIPVETRGIISRIASGSKREQDTFDVNGMKIEIIGTPNNANPDFTKNSQLSILTLTDDYTPSNVNSKTWSILSTKPTKQQKVKVQFLSGNDLKTLKINGITFAPKSETEFISKLTIKYNLEETGMQKIINNINVCTPFIDSNNILKTNSAQNWTYFFDTPIIASELTIEPNISSINPGITIVNIYGTIINNGEIDAYKEQTKKDYCTSDSNTDDLSNSASSLLSQQLEIQQLCDAMEMQDKIKENNQKIQKNRQYLIQLEEQDRKIAALEDVVQKMKHQRMVREKTSDKNMVAEKIKQDNIETQLAKLIEDRKKNMRQLNVTLKLNDASLNKMNQTVEKLENTNGIGNNTSTTSLEGFTNPQNKKEIQQYEYSQGFYYRPYADSTVQTQLVESHEKPSPDLRLFGLAFNSEKVSPMKFYENKVMCTKGCDVNTQFIKMQ